MFGIGFQEIVIVGVLFLVIFGPNKLPSMARDLGRFVNEARGYIDELKSELVSSEEETPKKVQKKDAQLVGKKLDE